MLPRARHREKPPVLRSLARLRVFSVVAGALALTGGVAAAVSMPAERTAGSASPPAGVKPPEAAVVPFAAEVVVPQPAKPAPKSVTPVAETSDLPQAVAPPKADSENVAVRRGNLAKAVKVVGKKSAVSPKIQSLPAQAAPVRHAIPDPALWWGRWAAAGNQQMPSPWGHHGCDGGRHHW